MVRDQELRIIPGGALFTRSAIAITTCAVLALTGCGNANQGSLASTNKPVFPIYTNAGATTNHYTSSGYMGDIGDIHINDAYKAMGTLWSNNLYALLTQQRDQVQTNAPIPAVRVGRSVLAGASKQLGYGCRMGQTWI